MTTDPMPSSAAVASPDAMDVMTRCGSAWANNPMAPMPALFTRMSRPPKAATPLVE